MGQFVWLITRACILSDDTAADHEKWLDLEHRMIQYFGRVNEALYYTGIQGVYMLTDRFLAEVGCVSKQSKVQKFCRLDAKIAQSESTG